MALSTKELIDPKNVVIGDATAPVTIRFYVDYESLACQQANEVVKQVFEANPHLVQLNIRHFPLTNKHQKAMKAAEAAVAASQEDKLWPMHLLLFQHRKQLGLISLKQYAKQAGVENRKFFDELVNGRYAWAVRSDLMEAVAQGFRDVPVILVNGQVMEGPVTVENLQTFIETVSAGQ